MRTLFAEPDVRLPPQRRGELLIDKSDLASVVYRDRWISNIGHREKVRGRPRFPSIFRGTNVKRVDTNLDVTPGDEDARALAWVNGDGQIIADPLLSRAENCAESKIGHAQGNA